MRIVIFCFLLALISADSCLTPDQDAQLKKVATIIDGTFKATVAALKIAEFSTSDPQTKQNLQTAITVIQNVDQYVVGNLTKIADEACGTCSQVTEAVRDGIDIIIDMISSIEPDWQNNPLFKAIVEAIHAILQIVETVCPDAEIVYNPIRLRLVGNDSCLTPEQIQQLEEATTIIDKTLKATVVGLETAAIFEKNATVKQQLKEAATIIRTVDKEVVQNLTRIANETCGTCDDIVKAVGDMVQIIEDSLTKIEPDWANNPIFKAVEDAIQAILEIVEAVCPDKYYQFSKLAIRQVGNDSCLTPAQDAKLHKITYIISKTLDLGSAILDIAIYFEKNATIKEQLFEAKEVVDTVNAEVVQNLTKIIDETCGTCDDIVSAVRDMVQIITDSIEQIEPEWTKNPIFRAILKAVDAILDIVKAVCDPATVRSAPSPSSVMDLLMPMKTFNSPVQQNRRT